MAQVGDAITAARLEELRFAKRQQWAVAIATITFIAGAFHIAHSIAPPLASWEKHVATGLVSLATIGGIWLLFDLQGHLASTRKVIDPSDKNPWQRGVSIVFGLSIALVISAAVVSYSFWRD